MKNKFQYLHNSKLIAENILELDFKINDIAYVLEDNTLKKTYVTKIEITTIFDESHITTPHVVTDIYLNHRDQPYSHNELFKSPNNIPIEDFTEDEVPVKKPAKKSRTEEPSDDLPF